MLQDIAPHIYHNQFYTRVPSIGDPLLIYQDGKALLRVAENNIEFPVLGEVPGIESADCRNAFRIDDTYFVLTLEKPSDIPDGFSWYSAREYRSFRPMNALFACAAGGSLDRWYRDNRYCGRCGAENRLGTKERSLVCPSCGRTAYPKICPAVIVAVRNGEKLLLTKYAGRASKGYALIAGFNEIGETIEETVHREVLEEVGIRVHNLKFYKSQPWVITDTLLMGFYCDLDGSDSITLQEDELSTGIWVDRTEVPEDTTHVSLTSEMIEQFRLGKDL